MPTSTPLKLSPLEEIEYYTNLMNDSKTLVDGITGLQNICSFSKVSIRHEQSTIFLNILQNSKQNADIIEQTLILIEKILQFEENYSSEVFSDDSFLDIFFINIELTYSINSLYHIVNTDKYSALSVLNFIKSSPEIVDFLLTYDSANFDLNVHFLSAFIQYNEKEIVKFLSGILDKIFKLLIELELSPSGRYSCLLFIHKSISILFEVDTSEFSDFDSFSHNKSLSIITENSLFDIILDHDSFPIVFKKPPNNKSERIIELKTIINLQKNFRKLHMNYDSIKVNYKSEPEDDQNALKNILEEEYEDDEDTFKIILNKDLFPFILSCLKINMEESTSESDFVDFEVVCYAFDIIKEMASNGVEATEFLFNEEVPQEIWELLNGEDDFDKNVHSLMAILEIFKHSKIEDKNWFVQNGLFEIIDQTFGLLSDTFLRELLFDLKKIVEISLIDENDLVINSLFETESLIEQLEELSMDSSEPNAPVAFELINYLKSLTESADHVSEDS